jgi:hypothetical protein
MGRSVSINQYGSFVMKNATSEKLSLVATILATVVGWTYLAVEVGSKLIQPAII